MVVQEIKPQRDAVGGWAGREQEMALAGLGEGETGGWRYRQVDGLMAYTVGKTEEVPAQQVPSRACHAAGAGEDEAVGQTTGPTVTGWVGGLTLGLQVAEQRLGMVQGAGGQATHAVLSQAAGGAQQRVPVLSRAVSIEDRAARAPDQRQGHHTLHHVLREEAASEGPPGVWGAQPHLSPPSLSGPG